MVYALTVLAKRALKKHNPRIIAITGSVGKTTTKDIIYYSLKDLTDVRASKKSFNSDIGVPLSIFGLNNPYVSPKQWMIVFKNALRQLRGETFPSVLVLEVGAGSPGDISGIAPWLRPDISVFTQLSRDPVHLEFFDSPEDVYQEKKSLAVHTKESGVVLYNGKDPILERLLNEEGIHTDTFNVEERTDTLRSDGIEVSIEGDSVLLKGITGKHFGNMVSIVRKISQYLGYSTAEMFESLEKNFTPTRGRGRLIRGINNAILIDDAYNASPVAVRASLKSFEEFKALKKKIFVFGDMMELGNIEGQAHREVTEYLSFIDMLITVGQRAQQTHDAVPDDIEARHFNTSDEAGKYLKDILQEGDAVLFKGSRHAIKMERAIVQVALPEEREKLVQDYL